MNLRSYRRKEAFTGGVVLGPEGEPMASIRTWLEGTKTGGMSLGLKHTKQVLERLNLSHNPKHILHVAGSNGKGTVCALMACGLTLARRSNVFFSSPHLIRVEERIRVDGKPVSAHRFDEAMNAVRSACETPPFVPLTFFEATYLAAMWVANDAGVEVVILETGLGGRLDATRSGPATASLVTAISAEHQDILGESIALIAREKAAIARPGCPILMRNPEEKTVEQAMLEEAQMAGQSELGEPQAPAAPHIVNIPNGTSVRTEALILATALFNEVGLPSEHLAAAFERVHWPARLQHVAEHSSNGHPFLLDAAHNPSGLQRVLPELEQHVRHAVEAGKGWTLFFGTSPQKNLASFCKPLIALATRYPPHQIVFTEPQGGRYPGVACQTLADLAWPFAATHLEPLPQKALKHLSSMAPSEVGLVISLGSLYLQGNILEALDLSSDEDLSLLSKHS